MLGPKIIRDDSQARPAAIRKHDVTGIRRTNDGGWAAIRAGRCLCTFRGLGAQSKAVRAAGTNRVIV